MLETQVECIQHVAKSDAPRAVTPRAHRVVPNDFIQPRCHAAHWKEGLSRAPSTLCIGLTTAACATAMAMNVYRFLTHTQMR